MFAGLPGIGVGTLFYVLAALWMPVRELGRLVRGDFSLARWRLIIVQFAFAITIVASIAVADRVLASIIADGSIQSVTPARLINDGFALRVPESFWAAPVAASLLLLGGVLVLTELARAALALMVGQRSRVEAPDDARRRFGRIAAPLGPIGDEAFVRHQVEGARRDCRA